MIIHLKHYLRVFALLFFYLNSFSQTEIFLDNLNELQNIGEQTYFYEDASLELSIEDIIDESQDIEFKVYPEETLNFSSTASAYWIKFKIFKVKRSDFYLNVGSAYIDSISLYEFDKDSNLISTRHTGDDLPFDTREVKVGDYLFALNFDVGDSRTFYLRVKSDQPLFFPLKVGTLANFAAFGHDLDFIQGIYFGFMLLIFLYNLFLYFSTRERIYLYYIAYVFSVTWFSASGFGYFFEYLWPNIPFINQQAVVSTGLTIITATLFTQKFLNTKESEPRWHKGSIVFLVIGFLVCVLVLIGFKIEGLKLAQVGLLFMAIYFLVLGIRFKQKGYHPAIYYLFAWGALLVGMSLATLESLNMAFVKTHFINGIQIGSALEVLLLSFALGDRINMYKKQKEDAQLKALATAKENEKLIKEQNTILEKKVEERTAMIAIRNKELVNLNKEKDMLVNIVAHDLRTPLGQVKMLVQLFNMTPTKLTKDQETYLTEIENSADRLMQMIGRILDVHALETKQLKLTNEIVGLVELVAHVMQSFKAVSSEKNIKLTLDEEGDCFAEIDRNYMIQVLENLISNAIKFSERGTEVILRVKCEEGRTRVIVEDHGPGISEKDQKKLFGKFQRLSAQPTAGEASTGLGLSIVKKYVEAMNGKIHCKSQLGVGTQFIVTFGARDELAKA